MTPELSPSKALRRAAAAEIDRLTRAQQRVQHRLKELRTRAGALEDELRSLEARQSEIEVLLGEPTVPSAEAAASAPRDDGRRTLRGAALRSFAVAQLLAEVGPREAMHYKDWFALVLKADVDVGGKDPLATFLTTATRSPLIERGPEPGTYFVEPDVISGLRDELSERHAELRDLTEVLARGSAPDERLQEHRKSLLSAIQKLERSLREAEEVLRGPLDIGDSNVGSIVSRRQSDDRAVA